MLHNSLTPCVPLKDYTICFHCSLWKVNF